MKIYFYKAFLKICNIEIYYENQNLMNTKVKQYQS